MTVTEREWSLIPSRASAPAGRIDVHVVNNGEDPHNVAFRRQDGGAPGPFAFPDVPSLEERDDTVTLTPGTWVLYCTLAGHEGNGMKAVITIV